VRGIVEDPIRRRRVLPRALVAGIFGLVCTTVLTIVPVLFGPSVRYLYLAGEDRPLTTRDAAYQIARIAGLNVTTPGVTDCEWMLEPLKGQVAFGIRNEGVSARCEIQDAELLAEKWSYGWPFYTLSLMMVWRTEPDGDNPKLMGGWRVPGTSGMRSYTFDSVTIPLNPNYLAILANVLLFSLCWLIPANLWRWVRESRRVRENRCPRCGYPSKSSTARCSECGNCPPSQNLRALRL
jgi:hypothetical protein